MPISTQRMLSSVGRRRRGARASARCGGLDPASPWRPLPPPRGRGSFAQLRRELHDADLVGLLAVEDAGHAALVHHHDAVAHAQHLRQLRGDHDHRDALAGELARSAGGSPPWRRRRCRASARRGSGCAGWSAASGRSAPSAGCRRRGCSTRSSRSRRLAPAAAVFMLLAQRARSRAGRRSPPRVKPSRRTRHLHVVHDVEQQEAAASPCGPRSGSAMPASMATPRRVRCAIGLPSIAIAPAVAGVTPKIVSATLLRPEPTSPARPRISPLRRSKETSWKQAVAARGRRTDEHHLADRHVCLREHLRDLAPDHQRDDVVAVDVLGRVRSPTKRPSRNTETSSAISNSSFILCVM